MISEKVLLHKLISISDTEMRYRLLKSVSIIYPIPIIGLNFSHAKKSSEYNSFLSDV